MNHKLRKLIDEHKESEAVDQFLEFKRRNPDVDYNSFPTYHEVLNLIKAIEEIQVRSSATPPSQGAAPPPPQAQKTPIDLDSSSLDESGSSETSESEKESSSIGANMTSSTILPRKRKNIKKILSQSQLTPGRQFMYFSNSQKLSKHKKKKNTERSNLFGTKREANCPKTFSKSEKEAARRFQTPMEKKYVGFLIC